MVVDIENESGQDGSVEVFELTGALGVLGGREQVLNLQFAADLF